MCRVCQSAPANCRSKPCRRPLACATATRSPGRLQRLDGGRILFCSSYGPAQRWQPAPAPAAPAAHAAAPSPVPAPAEASTWGAPQKVPGAQSRQATERQRRQRQRWPVAFAPRWPPRPKRPPARLLPPWPARSAADARPAGASPAPPASCERRWPLCSTVLAQPPSLSRTRADGAPVEAAPLVEMLDLAAFHPVAWAPTGAAQD
mmetsp:Transcript_18286/g.64224  ORF Transcript_18286/g.64224 Transcript_18286/m.64224 type:complete len:205 (+) Transcript_18286:288-902(+)